MSISAGRIYDGEELKKIISRASKNRLALTRTGVGDLPTPVSDIGEILQGIPNSPLADLFAGDKSAYGDDHSRADCALCYGLAPLTGCDRALMDELFRKSGLFRDKCDEKRGDSTYGLITIDNAIKAFQANTLDLSDSTELGTADKFVQRYGAKCCHVAVLGWLFWENGRWNIDGGEAKVKSMLIDMCEEFYRRSLDELRADTKSRTAEENVRNARKMRSNIHITGALKLAESKLYASFAEFDQDACMLNTPDGVVDLRTREIVPHSPAMKCIHITSVGPVGISNGKWLEHVAKVTGGDQSLVKYLRLVTGMMVFGRVCEEMLVIAFGVGSNGKSTFFNAIQKVLGSYSITVSPEIFQATRSKSEKTDFHVLRGTRCVLSYEAEEYKGISPAKMKRLTSTDRIEARVYYKNSYSFDPSHTMVLVTNHLPNLSSLDHGTWRRITVLPFNTVVPHEEAVTNYAETLVEEDGVGIMQFILEGAREFASNGFKIREEDIPQCVKDAIAQYRQSQNWVEDFIGDVCVVTGCIEDKIASSDMYSAYVAWTIRTGEKQMPSKQFSPLLEQEGKLAKVKTNKGRFWLGVKLIAPEDRDEG